MQPDSKQNYLLGINAIPLLGIQVSKPNGDSLVSSEPDVSKSVWLKQLQSLLKMVVL